MNTAIVILLAVAFVAQATEKTTPELPIPVVVGETDKKLEKRGFAYSGNYNPATFARFLKVAAVTPPVPSSPFMDFANNGSSVQYPVAPTLAYDEHGRPMGYVIASIPFTSSVNYNPVFPTYRVPPNPSGSSSSFMDTSNNASTLQYSGTPNLSYDQYARPMSYGGAAPAMTFDRFASPMDYGGVAPMPYDRLSMPMGYGVSCDRYRSLLGLGTAPAVPRPSYVVYY